MSKEYPSSHHKIVDGVLVSRRTGKPPRTYSSHVEKARERFPDAKEITSPGKTRFATVLVDGVPYSTRTWKPLASLIMHPRTYGGPAMARIRAAYPDAKEIKIGRHPHLYLVDGVEISPRTLKQVKPYKKRNTK